LGILLKDANIIQFTEDGGHSDETPAYIQQSAWTMEEVFTFGNYVKEIGSVLVG